MRRSCDLCGTEYEAKTVRSRYDTDLCRKRALRGVPRAAEVKDLPLQQAVEGLASAVRLELVAGDRQNTALGRAALALAARIDAQQDTGSGVASLARELRATLTAALAGVAAADSPVVQMRDELAARRRA
jgi:hypothetical protein